MGRPALCYRSLHLRHHLQGWLLLTHATLPRFQMLYPQYHLPQPRNSPPCLNHIRCHCPRQRFRPTNTLHGRHMNIIATTTTIFTNYIQPPNRHRRWTTHMRTDNFKFRRLVLGLIVILYLLTTMSFQVLKWVIIIPNTVNINRKWTFRMMGCMDVHRPLTCQRSPVAWALTMLHCTRLCHRCLRNNLSRCKSTRITAPGQTWYGITFSLSLITFKGSTGRSYAA